MSDKKITVPGEGEEFAGMPFAGTSVGGAWNYGQAKTLFNGGVTVVYCVRIDTEKVKECASLEEAGKFYEQKQL